MTPLKSIRKCCLSCCNGSPAEVRHCVVSGCELHLYRLSKGRPKLKMIRQKCKDCSGGSTKEIKNCLINDCPLYAYRFGKWPKDVSKVGIKKFIIKSASPTAIFIK